VLVCIHTLAIDMQISSSLCRIILPSVACLAVQFFSPHNLINRMIFEKKSKKNSVLISPTTLI